MALFSRVTEQLLYSEQLACRIADKQRLLMKQMMHSHDSDSHDRSPAPCIVGLQINWLTWDCLSPWHQRIDLVPMNPMSRAHSRADTLAAKAKRRSAKEHTYGDPWQGAEASSRR